MSDELVHHIRLSPNFNERALPITMVVLHYTEMKPVESALERLCDPAAEVSAHYLISEEGEVTLLVPEDKRARSEEHTSELRVTNAHLVCRLLLEKKKPKKTTY